MPTLLLVTEDRATQELIQRVSAPLGWSLEPCATVSNALEHIGKSAERVSLTMIDVRAADDETVNLDDVGALVRNTRGVPLIVLAGIPASAWLLFTESFRCFAIGFL
jgi:hypothetical protein